MAAALGGLLVVAFIVASLFGADGVARHEQLRGELRELDAMNERLQRDNQRLEAETEALRTNPDYLEHVIRDELGWVADDEMVLIFDESDAAP